MNKTKTILAAASILLTSLAFLPAAEAHECSGGPANCGTCDTGDHNHRDESNVTYCSSSCNATCRVFDTTDRVIDLIKDLTHIETGP